MASSRVNFLVPSLSVFPIVLSVTRCYVVESFQYQIFSYSTKKTHWLTFENHLAYTRTNAVFFFHILRCLQAILATRLHLFVIKRVIIISRHFEIIKWNTEITLMGSDLINLLCNNNKPFCDIYKRDSYNIFHLMIRNRKPYMIYLL